MELTNQNSKQWKNLWVISLKGFSKKYKNIEILCRQIYAANLAFTNLKK